MTHNHASIKKFVLVCHLGRGRECDRVVVDGDPLESVGND